jgi:hypothetical protein
MVVTAAALDDLRLDARLEAAARPRPSGLD